MQHESLHMQNQTNLLSLLRALPAYDKITYCNYISGSYDYFIQVHHLFNFKILHLYRETIIIIV